jgi:hypothetical protein
MKEMSAPALENVMNDNIRLSLLNLRTHIVTGWII